ncbi:thermonuclease family protein [Saccharibacillus sp. JS10]|uniref:thermonuclease family protein n=1 Tax=Saccharibacillus sp. JS10 TaxID=2950552 RepID=UPI002108CB45|nr:thermonuclease family protein [Saccharibacillus sp. JS10]MCQ4087678.1 thermonuclease family protein [Saccharibacillus sp. JS10]
MNTPHDPNGQPGKTGRPKPNIISIVITIVVLAILLFTTPGRELLNNIVGRDGKEQTQSQQPNTSEQTATTPAPVEGRVSATVERIVDGDTVIVNLADGSRERVRMLLIDTPETKKEGTPVQPFGLEASEYTKKLLTGKSVELEFDQEQRDQYDRMLAYIYLDNKMVNTELLEKGLARVVVYQPNDKYIDEFRDIQAKAKKAKIGVWSVEGYADNRGFHPEVVQ